MSQSNPARQSAEADFLSSLDHLGETFGDLEDDSLSASGKTDGIAADAAEESLEAIADSTNVLGTSPDLGIIPKAVSKANPKGGPKVIAEGYDERNSNDITSQTTNRNPTKD
ncbi:MAG: hypothetical protein AAF685_15635 [Cyanobacteria bacterium P01_C01_bin.89]